MGGLGYGGLPGALGVYLCVAVYLYHNCASPTTAPISDALACWAINDESAHGVIGATARQFLVAAFGQFFGHGIHSIKNSAALRILRAAKATGR